MCSCVKMLPSCVSRLTMHWLFYPDDVAVSVTEAPQKFTDPDTSYSDSPLIIIN